MQVRRRLHLEIGEADWQSLAGFIRLFFFGFAVIIAIGWYGSTHFDGVNPAEIARQWKESIWFLGHLPVWFLTFFAAIFNISAIRFMIAPTFALLFILVRSAKFVQDVYALPDTLDGLRYVIASLFGVRYPVLHIEKGEKQIKKHEVNLIDKIGGPGFAIIEPGNAAMFRRLRVPGLARVSETFFLAPFETIASTVDLDEQHGQKEVMSAMTRDGIKVLVKDIHFRYQVGHRQEMGASLRRTLNEPFPFSEDAIRNMTFNLLVQNDGLESWRDAVERAVTGTIADFITAHSVDYLTAPRTNEYRPRLEIKDQLFVEGMRRRLAVLGAELLWVDAGHIEIEDESVDELRTNLWSAEWAGDAANIRAYGDAVQQAYQELGRAEAQADLIVSISNALNEIDMDANSVSNVRRLLLARTGQLLNAMRSSAQASPPPNNGAKP